MLFARIHFGCDRVPPPHPSLVSLVVSLVCSALVTASLWVLDALLPPPRYVCSRRVPDDVVQLILEAWSPTALNPVVAYAERNSFFCTCALVHRTWTRPARRLLHEDLLVAHPSHPLVGFSLRPDCIIEFPHVKRLVYSPHTKHFGSTWRMLPGLRMALVLCENLTSMAFIEAGTLELADLGYAKNLRELHVHNIRISPPTPHPAQPFQLPHLLHISLTEVCFTMSRPAFATLLCPDALPRLRTISMHHCDVMWTSLRSPRQSPHVTHLRFTHPPNLAVTHLAPLQLPALTSLTLCTVALHAILTRMSTSPEECAAALALVAQAKTLRVTEDPLTPLPHPRHELPVLDRHPQTQVPRPPPPHSGSRTLAVPLAVPALRGWALTATVRWVFAWDRAHLLTAVRAHRDALALVADGIIARAILPRCGGHLVLPFAAEFPIPGPRGVDADECERARVRLARVCWMRGVCVTFLQAEEEEREWATEVWGWWAGCAA
ncbi:hypothetical protein JCM3770_007130 [Rhodotorula araucariae]